MRAVKVPAKKMRNLIEKKRNKAVNSTAGSKNKFITFWTKNNRKNIFFFEKKYGEKMIRRRELTTCKRKEERQQRESFLGIEEGREMEKRIMADALVP